MEIHAVESVFGITGALQCGDRANYTDILGSEECREIVVAQLANGDQVAVSQGSETF